MIQKSLRKICQCDNKQCVLEKMAVRLCHIKDPGEEIKQTRLTAVISGLSQGFTTTSQV